MKDIKPLSPCVQSAVSSLSGEVTAWDLVKHLFEMHPEYTHGKISPYIADVDRAYKGEKKPVSYWLEQLVKRYPKEDLLHTQLVLFGLYKIDPELNQLLPTDIMEILQKEIRFNLENAVENDL